AVRGLVLVDDALRDGLVELLRRGAEGDLCLLLVTGGDRLAGATHRGLQLALDGLVALRSLLVLQVALDLRLDVRQKSVSSVTRTARMNRSTLPDRRLDRGGGAAEQSGDELGFREVHHVRRTGDHRVPGRGRRGEESALADPHLVELAGDEPRR